MKEDLVERIARAICRAWFYCDLDSPDGRAEWDREQNKCRKQARACLSEIESAGLVIVPRGSVAMLLEVHMRNSDADDWAINIGARPEMWHDQSAYVQAWDSLRAALADK